MHDENNCGEIAISFNSQNNDMMTEGRRHACVPPKFARFPFFCIFAVEAIGANRCEDKTFLMKRKMSP